MAFGHITHRSRKAWRPIIYRNIVIVAAQFYILLPNKSENQNVEFLFNKADILHVRAGARLCTTLTQVTPTSD